MARTSTWAGRNYERLQRVKEEAARLQLQNPTIINVGPGGVVDFLFDYFPVGKMKGWTKKEKLAWQILRVVENTLRRAELFDLRTSEPQEILNIFQELEPKQIYVVDREQKVLDAVKRLSFVREYPLLIDYALVNVANQPIPFKGDIVVAYRVAQRTSNPRKSLENIAESVNNGGLLSLNEDFEVPGFRRLDSGLYVKEREVAISSSNTVLHDDPESVVTLNENGLVKKRVYKVIGSGLKFDISAQGAVDREIRALELLADVPGVQKLVARESGTSFTSHYIEADPLKRRKGDVPNQYFDDLAAITRICEDRGVYRIGQNRADFLVTKEKKPALVDFGNVIFRDDLIAQIPLVLLLAKIYSRLRIYDLRRRYAAK
ncbi:hypothetical protein HYX08_05000 [Candidatus Woesearchaeota archaeon]|nr:hypothetical protein [Candidatus Woesearchaeota archaeon]